MLSVEFWAIIDVYVKEFSIFSALIKSSFNCVQVNSNLFSFSKPEDGDDEATPTSPAPSDTKYYINELQLQYATIISKPTVSLKENLSSLGEKVDPKFYNVRPMGGVNSREGAESMDTQTVDQEVSSGYDVGTYVVSRVSKRFILLWLYRTILVQRDSYTFGLNSIGL